MLQNEQQSNDSLSASHELEILTLWYLVPLGSLQSTTDAVSWRFSKEDWLGVKYEGDF